MRSTSHKKILVFAFLLLAASSAFGQCTVPPCVNIDKQTMGSVLPSFGTDAGAVNAYVVTTRASLGPGLRDGSLFYFAAANANTGASTLNIDGTGVIAVKKMSSGSFVDLASGDIGPGQVHFYKYNSSVPRYECVTCAAASLLTPVSVANGGTGTGSTLTGVVRGGNPFTAAELSGDASTSGSNAVTVAKVNGVSYPASPSTHAVPVITASNTATYKVVPDCQDTGGKHLNFTQSSDSITCGTTGGAAGVVPCTGGAGLAASYASTLLGEGSLLNYWKMDEAPGATTIADSKGSNTGTVSGGVTFGNVGCLGNGALFNGSSGLISVTRSIQDDFTIELWMKSTVHPGCDTQFYGFGQGLVGGEVAGVTNDFGVIFADYACTSVGNIVAGTGNPDTSVGSTAVVNDGNWHYVVFTRKKSTGTISLYVDDVLNASTGAGTQTLNAASTLFIGADPNFYSGYMQQLAFYSAVLSPTQINAHWLAAGGSVNGGTLTEIDTGTGLTGGPITGSGTISLQVPVTVANGGTGDTSLTAHSVLLGEGTSSLANTGTGVSGQCLMSNGSSDPSYQTCPGSGGTGGGLTLVEQHAASSSAALSFTTCISSTYDDYLVRFVNIVPATNNVSFQMLASTDGGSTYDSSAIYDLLFSQSWINSGNQGGTANTNGFLLAQNVTNNSNYGVVGDLKFTSPASTSLYKLAKWSIIFHNNSVGILDGAYGGDFRSTTAVNAFQVKFSSGNITSGTVRCYGLAK